MIHSNKMIPRNHNGFSTIVLSIVVIFFFLFLIILIQDIKITDKKEKIETMKREKVVAKAVSNNEIFEVEHETIGKSIKKEVGSEEVNLTVGKHSITFGK